MECLGCCPLMLGTTGRIGVAVARGRFILLSKTKAPDLLAKFRWSACQATQASGRFCLASDFPATSEPEAAQSLYPKEGRSSSRGLMASSRIEEVLPETYSRSLQLTALYGIRVPSAQCSKALRLVCADDWLRKNFPHLKRVKREPVSEGPNQPKTDAGVLLLLGSTPEIPAPLSSLLCDDDVRPFLVDVPKHEPLTREQYLEWNKIWPTSYRQPSWRPMYFKDEVAVRRVILHLLERTSQQQTQIDDGKQECSSSCLLTFKGSIVSEVHLGQSDQSFGDVAQHPLLLGHGPIVALQQLSQYILHLQKKETDLTLLLEHPDKRDRIGRRQISSSNSQSNEQTSHNKRPWTEIDSSSCPPSHSDSLFLPSSSSPLFISSAQYYAQGLVAVLSSEPCVMCSMALLHSRIDCAILPKNSRNFRFGGLGGLFSLHCDERMNHNFHTLII